MARSCHRPSDTIAKLEEISEKRKLVEDVAIPLMAFGKVHFEELNLIGSALNDLLVQLIMIRSRYC